MRELIVSNKFNNKKLQSFLTYSFPVLSNSLFYKTLRKKDIKVNNLRVNENVILHTGDNVKIYISDELLSSISQIKIDTIYEDENILIVNKPSQVEVVGDNSLTSLLKNQLNLQYLEPCHRLDRNTTGLTLFAKKQEALKILLNKFRNHEIEKYYIAMVYGVPKPNEQILQAYLFKDNKKSQVYISEIPKKGYVPITTKYTVLSANKEKNYAILDVELLTGKTHQIRAHLAHIGYPIIGDGKYGKNEINKKFGFKTQKLCSYKLKFCFSTKQEDSATLDYLNGKEFVLSKKDLNIPI